MARKPPIDDAEIIQTLFWYDGPQIVLLSTVGGRYLVAVATDEEENDNGFIAAWVGKQQLADYQAERFDLRFLMTRPSMKKWFYFLWPDSGTRVSLKPLKPSDEVLDRNIPDAGLFSRAHEAISAISSVSPTLAERFQIDGTWDLKEFSSFYGKIEDIYYIFHTIDRIEDESIPKAEKEAIVERFSKPFRGGGSYRSMYDEIANDNDSGSRLLVSGIQYNSPGYVEVKARQEPFNELISLLSDYSHDGQKIRRAYGELDSYLSKSKLKRADKSEYITDNALAAIEAKTRNLCSELNDLSYESLLFLSEGSVLVCAKIALSIGRRTGKLFEFFAQGRVEYQGLEVSSADLLSD